MFFTLFYLIFFFYQYNASINFIVPIEKSGMSYGSTIILQVLNLLTEKEVKLVLPTQAIVPRTFILKPGMVLFLAALGRVDYLEVREERIL